MERDNVELIHRILSGDDEAFSVLVRKYQRRVHALIWRKVGDFHIAEEITQDAFLQVYKKLSTLKNPKLFDFIFLIMGVGSQYLARFQNPYNVNAQSETTIEIIDAPIVLDTQAKPDLRNQAGRFDATGKTIGAGPQVSEPVLFAAAEVETEESTATKPQWRQASGPAGVSILYHPNGTGITLLPMGSFFLQQEPTRN